MNFTYAFHEIYNGKKNILPLPATYVESGDEAQTLEITLHDAVMDTDLILSYTIYEEYPVITRNAKVSHNGSEKIVLDKIMSASVEFNDMDYEMVQLSGGWSRERYVKNRKLEMGIQSIQSLNGTCHNIVGVNEKHVFQIMHSGVIQGSKFHHKRSDGKDDQPSKCTGDHSQLQHSGSVSSGFFQAIVSV